MALAPRFKEYSASLPFPLTEEQIERLDRYYALLVQWNESMNLVSRKSLETTAFSTHFVDSLWICKTVLEHRGQLPLIDIGSGGGFPGIVLAILEPQLPITLFEKATKKQTFLSAVVAQLELPRVSIDGLLPRQVRPVFACSRAAIGVDEYFSFFRKMLIPPSRTLLCAGGDRDLTQPPEGFRLIHHNRYELPQEAGYRTIAVYELVPRGTKSQ